MTEPESEATVSAEPWRTEPPAPPPCPVQDAAGRRCERQEGEGHEGQHAVAMEPMEVVCRQAVSACIAHRDRTAKRSPLLTAREVKLDMILDNQAAILNGLAMVLDGVLRAQGLPGEIRILGTKGDGRA